MSIYQKNYYLNNKGRYNKLIKKYNITIEEYENLLKLQEYCCAICKTHASVFKRKLAVDHNHSTGKIRGLLCANCNSSLGKLKDDINILNRAIKYLEKHND